MYVLGGSGTAGWSEVTASFGCALLVDQGGPVGMQTLVLGGMGCHLLQAPGPVGLTNIFWLNAQARAFVTGGNTALCPAGSQVAAEDAHMECSHKTS